MKTFKNVKSFLARAGAVFLLVIAALCTAFAMAYVAAKLLMLAGLSATAVLQILNVAGFIAGTSIGIYFAARPDKFDRVYKWVHNFAHWNDEVYIVA